MTQNEYITIIVAFTTLIGTGLGAWVNMKDQVTKNEANIENIRISELISIKEQLRVQEQRFEDRHSRFDDVITKIFDKLEKIQETLNNKADR